MHIVQMVYNSLNLDFLKLFENPLWILLCYSSKLEEFDTLTLTRPLIIIKQRDDTKYYIQSTAFLILILPNQKFRLGIHFNLLSRFYLGTVCCFLKCYEICTYLDIPDHLFLSTIYVLKFWIIFLESIKHLKLL